MLLQNTVVTRWNPRTKRHYESLGYCYTGMGTTLEVSVWDLRPSSQELVLIECDFCHVQSFKTWYEYKIKQSKFDACKGCVYNVSEKTFLKRYGVNNPNQINEFLNIR